MAPPKRQRRTQALDNLGSPADGYLLTGDPGAEEGMAWGCHRVLVQPDRRRGERHRPDVAVAVDGHDLMATDPTGGLPDVSS